MKTVIVSAVETAPGTYRLAFDGKVLGDSPGFRKEAALLKVKSLDGRVDGNWTTVETLSADGSKTSKTSVWEEFVYRAEK